MPSDTSQRIRHILDELVGAERRSNDDREEIHDRVALAARALPREGVLEALRRAIGRSRKRREAAVFIVSELLDTPEVVDHVAEWLRNPDATWRNWLLQSIRQRGLSQFAPSLTTLIEADPDPTCRDEAIRAAGAFKDPINMPALLRLAESPPAVHVRTLTWAFKDYATPACQPFLQSVFATESYPPSLRIVAAWGLAKLGAPAANSYLERMLSDPELRTATSYSPGESFRAAQALADLHGWPFSYNRRQVDDVRQRLAAVKAT